MQNERSTTWRYSVCGLLLCATMLLYMDRLTLSVLAKRIKDEYGFSNEQYGGLDAGLSYAFAGGAFFFGFLVDRIGPRWLYPGVLVLWSLAGLATAYSDSIGAWFRPEASLADQTYLGFMLCRIALGFFESGHWPCALVTTQIMLSRADRSLGNSLLQSGAALGSILTPIIVLYTTSSEPGGWRPPFAVIGCIGILWIVPWFLLIGRTDLQRTADVAGSETSVDGSPVIWSGDFLRMLGVLIATVICINLTWQYFRVWLPLLLQEEHGYDDQGMAWFTSAYYVATDIGCLGVGFWVTGMTRRGWGVHTARVLTFAACAGMTLLAVIVACLPSANVSENGFFSVGSLTILALLLFVAAGTLGLFPNYYSFSQELSPKHQGKISGMLGMIAWIGSGTMQIFVGRIIDTTGSYQGPVIIAGLLPAIACCAIVFFWPRRREGER